MTTGVPTWAAFCACKTWWFWSQEGHNKTQVDFCFESGNNPSNWAARPACNSSQSRATNGIYLEHSYKLICFYWARSFISKDSNNSLIELQRIRIWNLAWSLKFAQHECLVPYRALQWDFWHSSFPHLRDNVHLPLGSPNRTSSDQNLFLKESLCQCTIERAKLQSIDKERGIELGGYTNDYPSQLVEKLKFPEFLTPVCAIIF